MLLKDNLQGNKHTVNKDMKMLLPIILVVIPLCWCGPVRSFDPDKANSMTSFTPSAQFNPNGQAGFDPSKMSAGQFQPSSGAGSFNPNGLSAGSFNPNSMSAGTFDPNTAKTGTFDPNKMSAGSYNPNSQSAGNFDPNNQNFGNFDPAKFGK